MRIFPDTNVLASAFGTRGLCADVLRLILDEHELVTGEVAIDELRRVLAKKFRLPLPAIDEIEALLRNHQVVPGPVNVPNLGLGPR